MSELLLELYSEEMPFQFLKEIENRVKDIFNKWLKSFNIVENSIKVYITPCRIVVYINNIDDLIKIDYKEIIGPKLNAKEEEIKGFLKAFNISSEKELKKNNKNFILVRKGFTINTVKLLENEMPNILLDIVSIFPENVKWVKNNKKIKWISPLRNILCIFNDKVLDFEFCGLKTNNSTYGHKTIIGFDKNISVCNFEDYKNKMRENFVIFDQNERKEILTNEISIFEKQYNLLSFRDNNDKLLEEIIYTTEYPAVLCGEFNVNFTKLPKFILTNEIIYRYKCLCLTDTTTNIISNKFIIFINTKTNNNGRNIIEDLNNTINNRLNYIVNELNSFISESLENKINKLKEISYYDSFGTIYDKVERLSELSKFICLWIPHTDLIAVEQAAKLSKIDSTTTFIRDNLNLKGYLSSYYAQINSYSIMVCDALKEYYKPRNVNDTIPITNIGKILSIADKMDNISSAFIIDEDISSSKDLYSMKKNIFSIIRIIIESKINISLTVLVYKSLSLFKTKIYKLNNNTNIKVKDKISFIAKNIVNLFKKRFIWFLDEHNHNHNVVLAVLNSTNNAKNQSLNLILLYDKILKIEEYIKTHNSDFTIIKNTYKRLNNILEDFYITDMNILFKKIFHKRNVKNNQEKEINNIIKENKIKIKKASNNRDYAECFARLLELSNVTNNYFENNIIRTKNKKDTNRKMFLLYKIKTIFESFLNFDNL